LIRRIRELLYEQGFTISGARNKLDSRHAEAPGADEGLGAIEAQDSAPAFASGPGLAMLRAELTAILALLKPRA
jgi:hypothetical protein